MQALQKAKDEIKYGNRCASRNSSTVTTSSPAPAKRGAASWLAQCPLFMDIAAALNFYPCARKNDGARTRQARDDMLCAGLVDEERVKSLEKEVKVRKLRTIRLAESRHLLRNSVIYRRPRHPRSQ